MLPSQLHARTEPGEGIQTLIPFSNLLQTSCETPTPGLSLSAVPPTLPPFHQTTALLTGLAALGALSLSLILHPAGLKSTRTCSRRAIRLSLTFVCSTGQGTS